MPRIVVVTVTEGFRHDSIPAAERFISELAPRMGFEVVFARNEVDLPVALAEPALNHVKLVMFVNTTGELQLPSRESLLAWIASGGSFIGVHSAADTWHDWPAYIEMLGGEFDRHPAESEQTIFDNAGSSRKLFEEYYLFKKFDRTHVSMLLSLRSSPEDGKRGFFPLAWTRAYGQGRVLYTALGHRSEVWQDPWFQQHIADAIAWGLRRQSEPYGTSRR